MTLDAIIDAIAHLGFPIGVACFLLWERYKFWGLLVTHQAQEQLLLTEIRDALHLREQGG